MNGYCDLGRKVFVTGAEIPCWEAALTPVRVITLDREFYVDFELCGRHADLGRLKSAGADLAERIQLRLDQERNGVAGGE